MKRNEMKAKGRFAGICCVCFLMLAVTGCGDKVPGDVIQPAVMENLLYDYQIASTLASELSYSENYKKDAYFDYVFRKHHVTEAEFDSSMVWYSRHGEELSVIYDNLQKRFERDSEQMKRLTSRQSGEISVSLSGDTVDIWQDRTLYWLTASPYTNKVTFDLKADTSFKPKDMLVLEAEMSFLPKGKRSGEAVMALNVTFKNDSTQGITRVVNGPGAQRLVLRPDSAFEYKDISGFIYYASNEENSSGYVLVNDIRLIRTHVSGPSSAVQVGEAGSDSLKRPRITREPMRRNN